MKIDSNPGKNLIMKINGEKYARYPVKTALITPKDKNPSEIIKKIYRRANSKRGYSIY